MLRLETDPQEIAFVAQDTSELMVVNRIVQGLEERKGLKARTSAALGGVIASEMIPEQQPFYGSEAALIFAQLQAIAADTKRTDSPAAKQMVWEFHNPAAREYALERQQAREAELIQAGAPSIFDKVRPVKAWRADSANMHTAADLPPQLRR